MLTQTAGIAGKLSHSEVVPDIRRAVDHIAGDNDDDDLGNQADVATGDSQTDDVLAGDTDSQTVGGDTQSDDFGVEIQTVQSSGGEFYTGHTAEEVFGIEIR